VVQLIIIKIKQLVVQHVLQNANAIKAAAQMAVAIKASVRMKNANRKIAVINKV
jgi:hypothetical protein